MIAREHAVVLSGGGANGAYEIGVMEALFSGRSNATQNDPVDPTTFVGTSVGSYNAAAMVSLSGWGAVAAARKLREIWLEHIASHGDRPNGVFRVRGGGAYIARDAVDLARNWLHRGVDLAFSADSSGRRIFRVLDGADVVSTSPLEVLISETLDFGRLLHTDKKLRVVACNWDTGDPIVFANNPDPDDGVPGRRSSDYQKAALSKDNVRQAILASTAIPAVFPRVQIGDAFYVDGGVVMNTPLRPAIDAMASVLHVIHLEPKLAPLPLGRAPSAFEAMERILAATPARLIDADIRHAALRNQLSRKGRFRKLEIHRYYPRAEIGGMLGLLDFDRARMAGLVERGFRDAVEHDCKRNQCVV